MHSGEAFAACDALDAALDALTDVTALTDPERLELLRRLETVRRRIPAVGHEVIARLDSASFGGQPIR